MMTRIAVALTLLATVVVIGCSIGTAGDPSSPVSTPGGTTSGTVETNGLVSPTWIDTEVVKVEGNTVFIPASEVDSGKMLHFAVTTAQGDRMNFMAYRWNEETIVRANVCPPCRSVCFSLMGDLLDCNNCHTKFDASTGSGVSGACRDFPKAEVTHAISDSLIAMEISDLLAAYENTVAPGWP